MTPSGYFLRIGKSVVGMVGAATLAAACAVPAGTGEGSEVTGRTSEAMTVVGVSSGSTNNLQACLEPSQTIWSETGLRNPAGGGVCFSNTVSASAAGLPCTCTNGVEYIAPGQTNAIADDRVSYAFACPVGTTVGSLNLPLANDPDVDPWVTVWSESVSIVTAMNANACYGSPDEGWEIVVAVVSPMQVLDPGCAGSDCDSPSNPPTVVHVPGGLIL